MSNPTNTPDPAEPIPPRLHLGRLLLERDNLTKQQRTIDASNAEAGIPPVEAYADSIYRLNERIELIEDIAAGIGLGLIWHEDNKGGK